MLGCMICIMRTPPQAVMNGESLHVAGRLHGRRWATTTNRYIHLDDATLSQAVGRVAMAIELRLH